MATIIDVARSAGVSIAAVSLTMNDPDTRRVSDKTKQRILKAAGDLHYTPNRHAKALLNKRTNVLGLVLPMRPALAINEFIAEAISGIQDACSLRGYNLMLYPHTSETGRITPAELRGSHFADGLIFMHTRMTSAQDIRETTIALQSEGKAFVMLNGPALTSDVCSVGVDDALLGQHGAEYLLSRNHQHIGILAGSESSPSTPLFLKGIRKAIRRAKSSSPSVTIRFSEFSESRIAEAVNEWMRQENKPTAILCAYDQLVPALYQELQRRKVRIPQKMAVLGRGDLPLASYIAPPLTTFRVPIIEMGRIAANLLFDQIDSKDLPQQQRQVLLECQLVRRASA